jgi:hypothetical protein
MTRTGQPVWHSYRLFGLTFRSEIPLPELRETEDGTPDVVIERGAVPPPVGTSVKGLTATPDGAVLEVPDIGRFRMQGGARIEVDPDPAASDYAVRLFLLGSAMGALLHQRGLLPLHANAVDFGGRAVAFCGRSGAGKSTLAAAFHDRGRPLLSDDVCVVTPDDGGFLAQPGIPRVRLWRDAVERSGRDAETLDPAFAGKDKFVLPLGESHAETALPLAAVYALSRPVEPIADFRISRLEGLDAAQTLVKFTYRRAFALGGDARSHFAACLALSQAVPVFVILRPWDSGRVGELAALVEAHFAGL